MPTPVRNARKPLNLGNPQLIKEVIYFKPVDSMGYGMPNAPEPYDEPQLIEHIKSYDCGVGLMLPHSISDSIDDIDDEFGNDDPYIWLRMGIGSTLDRAIMGGLGHHVEPIEYQISICGHGESFKVPLSFHDPQIALEKCLQIATEYPIVSSLENP